MTSGTPGLEALRRLALVSGVQTGYYNDWGDCIFADAASLAATLEALGVDMSQPDAAEAQLRDHWHWRAEPVVVAWDDGSARLDLRLPAEARGRLECRLEREDGGFDEWAVNLDLAPVVNATRIGGRDYVARGIELKWLPMGYHRLHLAAAGFEQNVAVFAAPTRCYESGGGRRWGVFAPTYALRSDRNWGAGDYTDLGALADWLYSNGGDVVATLPLGPTFGDGCAAPSPYSPVSRLFWNDLYIDVEAAAAASASPAASKMSRLAELREAIEALRRSPLVDYNGLARLKRRVLDTLAAEEPETIDVHAAANPEVADYAGFRARQADEGRDWRRWPEGEAASASIAGLEASEYRYHVYAQKVAAEQLSDVAAKMKARGQDLYLDLPLGCHPDGYDAWRYRDSFASGVSCGAPPDALFGGGQDWGFAPMNPRAARASGHAFFRRMIAHHLEYASILRIDHVMSLHRLYWVPRGAGATKGVYVRYPADELYAILSIESHRRQATIAGENLGTVPGYVNHALARHNVYETHVLQYEMPGAFGRQIRPAPARSVASLNTHDMPPAAAFLGGDDIDERERIGLASRDTPAVEREARAEVRARLVATLREACLLEDAESDAALIRAAMAYAARGASRYFLVNMEDLWGETASQNIPGTIEEHPNWTRRHRFAIDELGMVPGLTETIEAVKAARLSE